MRVNVKIRSAAFDIECGSSGTNRVLWLALQAKYRYARQYDLDPDSITPIDMYNNQDGSPAWPYDLISECVKPGDVMIVLIRDCESTQTETPLTTLWERFAACEPKDYLPVIFALDLRRFDDPDAYDDIESSLRQKEEDHDDDLNSDSKLEHVSIRNKGEPKPKASVEAELKPSIVSVTGNFTKWRQQVTMIESETSRLYSVRLRMPPAAVLLFRFKINDRWVVSEAHQVMMDSKGLRLNVIRIPGGRDHDIDDAGRHFKSTWKPQLNLLQLGDLGLGDFAKAQLETNSDQLQMFKEDWAQVHSKDLVTTADMYRALKDTVWSHYRLLLQSFQAFSECSSSDGTDRHMSILKFWTFCQQCRISNSQLSLYQITQHSFDAGRTNDGKTCEPNTQFTRPEFFEGLIRLSMAIFPKLPPALSFQTLITNHIKPYALGSLEENSIRALIAESSVQQTYQRHQHDLLGLFESYCSSKGNRFAMGFTEFKELLTEFGIKTDGRAAKQTTMLFSCKQEDAADVEDKPGHQIVYGEFLEALARLADIRYRERLPLDCKLQRLFTEVFFRKAVRQITSS